MRFHCIGALALAVAIAGCGGHGSSSPIPPAGQSHVQPPSVAHKGTLALSIRIPKSTSALSARRHATYVSPATTQMIVNIEQSGSSIAGYPVTVPLSTLTTGDCESSLASTQCTLTLALEPGSYMLAVTLEDTDDQILSQNLCLPVTIVEGQPNPINMVLGGVANSLAVVPVTNYRMVGSGAGYKLYGNDPINFEVVALDADGWTMIGPGTPTATATLASTSNASLTTSAANPEFLTIKPNYGATDPTVPAVDSMTIQATPVPESGGTTITQTTQLAIYQPWVFVLDGSANTVSAFDEDGNGLPTAVVAAFTGGPVSNGALSGMAYGNDMLYLLSGQYQNAVLGDYALSGGAPITAQGSGTSGFGELGVPYYPFGLAFDSHNQQVYAGDYGSSNVAASYDAALNVGLQSLSTAIYPAYGVAYIPTTNQIAYDGSIGGVYVCNEAIAGCSHVFTGVLNDEGIAWDTNDQWIGLDTATCCGGGGIQLLDTSGTSHGEIASGLNFNALAYDPFYGNWLAANVGAITGYTTAGVSVPVGFGSIPSTDRVASIVVVP